MHATSKDWKQQAGQLPLQDRAALIEHLILSLGAPSEAECERLWAQEAGRRYHAYKAGALTARPADEALADARKKLAAIG